MKYLLIITIFLLPVLALAQGYTPMVDIGFNPNQNFNGYIDALYALSISIAALLAVIKIVIAGVKWMMSDVVTNKQEAKKDISGALLGLLIVLAAVLILTVINPNLTSVNLTLTPTPYTPTSTAPPPPLNTAAIITTMIGNGISLQSFPALTSQQQSLFIQNCTSAGMIVTTVNYRPACYTPQGGGWFSSGVSVSHVYDNQNNRTACLSNTGGVVTQDPINSTIIWCTYP